MKLKSTLLSVFLLSMLAPSAQAGFISIKPSGQSAASGVGGMSFQGQVVREGKRYQPVINEGRRPINIGMAKGGGRDVTLADALSQVVPPGWQVYADDDIDANAAVSWNGDASWVKVVERLMLSLGSSSVINWDSRTLTLKRAIIAESAAVGRAATRGEWQVQPSDRTVSVALEGWAKQAKRTLSWEHRSDFAATDMSFGGSFENAVHDLMARLKNSDNPPRECFYKSGLVRIIADAERCDAE